MKEYRELQDGELIKRYSDGDLDAFSALLDRYKISLFSFIKRSVNNKEAAEDIFQETFLNVIKNAPNYCEDGKFKGWLFCIANNICINYLKSKNTKSKYFREISRKDDAEDIDLLSEFPDFNPLPDELLESKEISVFINNALQNLTVEQREVFLLRMHGDLSFSEIAEKLNRPLNTVLGQMRSAMIKMKKHIKEYYEQ